MMRGDDARRWRAPCPLLAGARQGERRRCAARLSSPASSSFICKARRVRAGRFPSALPDAVSRALDNIGRVYARIGKFQQAIDTWEEKIPMAKSSLEKTWLFHEIGRCYLELNKAEAAQNYGQKSLQSAEEEGDVEWQLHATVLVAQAEVKLKDYRSAIMSFEKALEKAKLIHNEGAQKAIVTALDDISKSFIEELNERSEEATVYSLKDDCSSENTKDNFEKYRERRRSERSAGNQDGKQKEDARSFKEERGRRKEGGSERESKEDGSRGEKKGRDGRRAAAGARDSRARPGEPQ